MAPSAKLPPRISGQSSLAGDEYKFCRQMMLDDIKWMDQLEVYVVGAIAAVYIFILSQSADELIPYLSFLPFLIALAGALRTAALDSTIGVLNDYIERVEAVYPELGYTSFYRQNRSAIMRTSRWIVWGGLLIGTLIFFLIVLCKGAFWKGI